MGILRVGVSESGLASEHERLLQRLLRRGDEQPERRDGETLDAGYHPQAIELAARNWRERMVHEHASAAVFTQLVPQLMEAEATLDVKTVVTRSAMDELRHAGLCGQVVEYLGGEAVAEADLAVERLPEHPDCAPRERALRNVFFASCLSETVSMALLTEEREYVDDPFIRRVLKQLAGDESLHARLGWVYLAQCWAAMNPAERDKLGIYLPTALAYFEEKMLGAMPLADIPEPILPDARRLGFSESSRARSLLYDTIESVILPNLAAIGLPANDAWSAR
jgi:hypothetical protein